MDGQQKDPPSRHTLIESIIAWQKGIPHQDRDYVEHETFSPHLENIPLVVPGAYIYTEWTQGKRGMEDPGISAQGKRRRQQSDGDSGFDSQISATFVSTGTNAPAAELTELGSQPVLRAGLQYMPLNHGHTLNEAASRSQTRTYTSGSRSSSPTKSRASSPSKGGSRQKRIALKYTSPRIFLGPFAVDVTKHSTPPRIPPDVSSTIHNLSEKSFGYVPLELRSWIEEVSQGTELVYDYLIDTEEVGNVDTLREETSALHALAFKLYSTHADESSWYSVVREVLKKLAPGPSSILQVEESQTRSVCKELLPVLGEGRIPVPAVKTDFLIEMNPDHPEVASTLVPIFLRDPEITLSAFNDPLDAKTMVAGIIEVKPPAGDMAEGVYQFSIAGAATLARLHGLAREYVAKGRHMPVVGWVVHGHSWFLYTAYCEEDSSVRVLGPYPSGNTATILGVLRLLRVMDRAREWMGTEYWSYLKSILWLD